MCRRAAEAPSPGTDSAPVAVQTVAQRLSGVYGLPRPFLKSSPRREIKHSLLLPLQRRGRRGHPSLPLSPLGCCCVCRQWKRLLGTAWRRSCLFPLKDRDVYSSSQASSWETLYSRAVSTAVFPFRKPGAHGLIPLSPSCAHQLLIIPFPAEAGSSHPHLCPIPCRNGPYLRSWGYTKRKKSPFTTKTRRGTSHLPRPLLELGRARGSWPARGTNSISESRRNREP